MQCEICTLPGLAIIDVCVIQLSIMTKRVGTNAKNGHVYTKALSLLNFIAHFSPYDCDQLSHMHWFTALVYIAMKERFPLRSTMDKIVLTMFVSGK